MLNLIKKLQILVGVLYGELGYIGKKFNEYKWGEGF